MSKASEIQPLNEQLSDSLKGLKSEIEHFERKRLDFNNPDHSLYLKQVSDIIKIYDNKIADLTYRIRVIMHQQ